MPKSYTHLLAEGEIITGAASYRTRCGSVRKAVTEGDGFDCPRCIAGHERDAEKARDPVRAENTAVLERALRLDREPTKVVRPTVDELKIRAAADKRLRRRLRNLASNVRIMRVNIVVRDLTTDQFRETARSAEAWARDLAEKD